MLDPFLRRNMLVNAFRLGGAVDAIALLQPEAFALLSKKRLERSLHDTAAYHGRYSTISAEPVVSR